MAQKHEHFEFELSIGERLVIGDHVVSVMDSGGDEPVVLVERIGGDAEEFGYEKSLLDRSHA